jgi:hypothetical protein
LNVRTSTRAFPISSRWRKRRAYATIDITAISPEYLDLPSDFLTMRRARLSGVAGKPKLEFLSGVQMDEQRFNTSNVTGQPRYFSLYGREIELCPTPDANYVVEMTYRALLAGLTSSNATNWLLTSAPDVYLYATLMEAAPYIAPDNRVQLWAAKYQSSVDALNQLSISQSYAQSPVVMRVSGSTP